MGRFLQSWFRQAESQLACICGCGIVFWLDRRRSQEYRPDELQIRFTAAQSGQPVERRNLRRVEQLHNSGSMHEAGLQAFAGRVTENSAVYSYELISWKSQEKLFRRNRKGLNVLSGASKLVSQGCAVVGR